MANKCPRCGANYQKISPKIIVKIGTTKTNVYNEYECCDYCAEQVRDLLSERWSVEQK